jgi:hypothetical protein
MTHLMEALSRAWGRVAFALLELARRVALSPFARRLSRGVSLPGWIPLLGDIDGRGLPPPAVVELGGRRSMSAPTLEITVDGRSGTARPAALAPVAELFAGQPPFVFNVCFSCGAGEVYADPESIWFNVFFGYYQIDVPRRLWDRPFGYRRTDGGPLEIHRRDLAAIGEADWNHFSNFLYGVPLGVVKRHDQLAEDAVRSGGRIAVGARHWDQVHLDGVEVASAYTARPGQLERTPHSFLRGLWRAAFGRPRHHPAFPDPFFPTRMRARLLVSWQESDGDRDLGEPVYRTFIFGATSDQTYPARLLQAERHRRPLSRAEADGLQARAVAENAAFLQVQCAALEGLIREEFPHLGFAASVDDGTGR